MIRNTQTLVACYLAFLTLMLAVLATQVWANYAIIEWNTGRIDVIKDLYVRTGDRWTGADMKLFIAKLRDGNPGLLVPEYTNVRMEVIEERERAAAVK